MARRRLDEIVVVDVEATCWKGPPPKGQQSEIIEIGLCLLNVRSLQRSARRSLLVAPQRSTVSPFCTELTTLTHDQVAGGHSFAEACRLVEKEFKTRHRTWASYGDYDREQFERQCGEMRVPYPFGRSHLNIKNLLALMRGLSHEVSMREALELLNLPLVGTHHRGGDDAWNTAAILAKLLRAGR